jgi:serine/threonine protein kinase/tetratricopeptide (TPR) repeat protein
VATKCPKCHTDNPDTVKFCGECGTQLIATEEPFAAKTLTLETETKELTRGTVFAGRYEILEELGAGGMGTVYRVYDREIEEEMALKLIRPEIAVNRRALDRFKNELKVARKITHKSVCKMYDLGESRGTSYITMEYVGGENLKSLIRRIGQLPSGKAIFIAREIAEGLAEAHKLGVIHRDLKPGNIMIDRQGNAKIMDFGIARSLGAEGVTGEGIIVGTPEYMSPEQVDGKPADARSDLYSLGVILFEMLTGRALFEGETPLSVAHKHKFEPPPDPLKLNPNFPGDLGRIILRLLEKTREKRYQTTAEFLADLEAVEKTLPIAERIVSKKKPTISRKITVEFNPKKLVIPALVFFTLVVAGLILWRVLPPKKPARPASASGQPTLAVLYFENKSGDKKLGFWRNALPELLITDLSQSKYIHVIASDQMLTILRKLGLVEAQEYSSEDIRRIAAQTRASDVLRGSFIKAGEAIIITAGLQKVGASESSTVFRLEAHGENDIISKVDELTRQIKEGLNLTAAQISGDIHRDLKKITTGSTEAFKYYVEGKRLFDEQKFRESIAALEKAVALDAEFAMAYRQLAEDYNYLRNGEQYEKNLNKARSLLNRVPEREYYMIQAFMASSLQEAVDIYNKLLSIYPDDTDALGELGAQYRNMEKWPLAAQQFEKVLTIDASDELAYENLALIYSAQGDYQKAIDLLRSKVDAFAGYFSFHDRLATAYLCLHQYNLALDEARKARVADPTDFEPVELEGLIHLVEGDPASAETCFRELVSSSDPLFQITGRTWLGHLYLAEGRYDQLRTVVQTGLAHAQTAKFSAELRASEIYTMRMLSASEQLQTNDLPGAYEALNQAVETAQETERPDYINLSSQFRGVVLAKMKKFEQAGMAAQKLKTQIEKSGVLNDLRYYHCLMGEIAREKGDLAGAIRSFETALSLLPRENYKFDLHILFLDPLASAFYEKGDWEEARKTYEKITDLTTGRVRWGNLYAKSFYWLGKIHLARREKDRAARFFRQFLEIWSQADPGLPEVEDARKQLTGLETS